MDRSIVSLILLFGRRKPGRCRRPEHAMPEQPAPQIFSPRLILLGIAPSLLVAVDTQQLVFLLLPKSVDLLIVRPYVIPMSQMLEHSMSSLPTQWSAFERGTRDSPSAKILDTYWPSYFHQMSKQFITEIEYVLCFLTLFALSATFCVSLCLSPPDQNAGRTCL